MNVTTHLPCRLECKQNVFGEKAKWVCTSRVCVIPWNLIKSFTIFFCFFSGSSANVYLPKFTLYGTYNLKDILYKMGIMDVFTDKADLSGITGQPQHRISQVSHTAFCFMNPSLLILTSLPLQLVMMQNSCKEALRHTKRELLAYRVFCPCCLLCQCNWAGAGFKSVIL